MNFAHNSAMKAPTPPDKGSFPLDHDQECLQPMNSYIKCLADNKNQSRMCMELSKLYLQCRMDRGLMAKEDIDSFGYNELQKSKVVEPPQNPREPIIAGLRRPNKDR
ncbi:hypothetical protein SAMD00019534_061030 [Acytostelium subglobosum LB1]|uniref:hypothetical protein n=1 Tax=Acytostelium subglobosum LB1 TaxID=1410327 RepID=UPI000644CAF1|nr:hypothetical protein SAMD00019534_061030 [Acytostelium subglobosum LB1]GAM22928.1 hypothetical protein SAMD00019534_061030 [Acytostelium subglobosum LB1]|eukprot:XP_012754155.1 hypothetical protein SAMD00019534_061030 [Acytostelium subglobosum LB1]